MFPLSLRNPTSFSSSPHSLTHVFLHPSSFSAHPPLFWPCLVLFPFCYVSVDFRPSPPYPVAPHFFPKFLPFFIPFLYSKARFIHFFLVFLFLSLIQLAFWRSNPSFLVFEIMARLFCGLKVMFRLSSIQTFYLLLPARPPLPYPFAGTFPGLVCLLILTSFLSPDGSH